MTDCQVLVEQGMTKPNSKFHSETINIKQFTSANSLRSLYNNIYSQVIELAFVCVSIGGN